LDGVRRTPAGDQGGGELQDLKPAPEYRDRPKRTWWPVFSERIGTRQVIAEGGQVGLERLWQALYRDHVALMELRHRQLWQRTCTLHRHHGVPHPAASLHEAAGFLDEALLLQVAQEALDRLVVETGGLYALGRAPAHEAAERAPLVLD